MCIVPSLHWWNKVTWVMMNLCDVILNWVCQVFHWASLHLYSWERLVHDFPFMWYPFWVWVSGQYLPIKMHLEGFLPFLVYGLLVLWSSGRILQWIHSILGFFFKLGDILITVSISLLVIYVSKLFISSWLNFGMHMHLGTCNFFLVF